MELGLGHAWHGPFLKGPGAQVSFPLALKDGLKWASLLYGEDTGPGDTVVFVLPNSVDLASLIVTCWHRGIRCGIINPAWPVEKTRNILRSLPHPLVISSIELPSGDYKWKSLDAFKGGEERVPDYHSTLRWGSSSTIVATSGSGGDSKLVVHSRQNWYSAADAARPVLGLEPGDTWLLSLPLYHVSGISTLFRCLFSGVTVVVPNHGETLFRSIQTHAPTQVSLVATQLYRLLRDDKSAEALAKCKAVVMGGGPTPEPLLREALARGIPLVMSYGMTETAAMICCTRPGDPPERLMSSGKPLVEGTVSISAEGEILVRGGQLFLGYLQPDGSLHRPLTEDGWFRTGDLGHVDDAGYLHVTGRRDNMFISGGENIQPEEIESALRAIPGVEEAIVAPVEDAEWGRRPVAFVRMGEGCAFDPVALERTLREVLPGFKIPRMMHPWPEDLVQTGIKPARRDFEGRAKSLATD